MVNVINYMGQNLYLGTVLDGQHNKKHVTELILREDVAWST